MPVTTSTAAEIATSTQVQVATNAPAPASEPTTATSAPPSEADGGPVAFARRLLDQSEQGRGSDLSCASLELHALSGEAGILSMSFGDFCGGDAGLTYLRYDGDRLIETATFIEHHTEDGDPEPLASFERLHREAKALSSMCIDVPTNRLVPPDQWLDFCPPTDFSTPREVVARLAQQTVGSTAWSDECVDLLLAPITGRSGVLYVKGSGAPGCGSLDTELEYRDGVITRQRAVAGIDAVLGQCIRLTEWTAVPSVGMANCDADTDSMVDEPSPATDAVMASKGPRFAYSDGNEMWLLTQDAAPIRLGTGGSPAWSRDGRLLAWLPEGFSGSWVAVADTSNGDVLFRELPDAPVDTVVPLGSGFAVTATGIGDSPITPGYYVVTHQGSYLSASFTAAEYLTDTSAGIDVGVNWASDGDRLYAAVQEDPGNWYTAAVGVWTIDTFGRGTYRFNDCADGGCENNAGIWNLSPSPDGSYLLYNGGLRDACAVRVRSTLTTADRYVPIPLSWPDGLGSKADGYFTLSRAHWVSPSEFVAVATVITPDLYEDCDAHLQGQVVSCRVDGACRSLGIEAFEVAADSGGNLAVVVQDSNGPIPSEATIRWADGSQAPIGPVYQGWWTWSP